MVNDCKATLQDRSSDTPSLGPMLRTYTEQKVFHTYKGIHPHFPEPSPLQHDLTLMPSRRNQKVILLLHALRRTTRRQHDILADI